MSMYESEISQPQEPAAPPGPPPVEPAAPPPADAVPDYGKADDGTMASSSWWDSMADLTLCGKKVTNDQVKQIFGVMIALIIALVVVVIYITNNSPSDSDSDSNGVGLPSGPGSRNPSYNPAATTPVGGGSSQLPAGRTSPVGVSESGIIRLSGGNSQCTASGCTGRLEVYTGEILPDGSRSDTPSWGTVCGHWLWDNDEAANIACHDLGYISGSLFTYGASFNLRELPAHLGFQTCDGTEPSLLDCDLHMGGPDPDHLSYPAASCYSDPDSRDGCNSGCSNHIDQGVVCYGDSVEITPLQAWATNADGSSACSGCGANGAGGCDMHGSLSSRTDETHGEDRQTLFFGCIEFYTTNCAYDASANSHGSFSRALAEFSACLEGNADVPGYCHGSLTTASMLANHDVCEGGATQNIAFHIRIPLLVDVEQTIHIRYHADFGAGSFIGMDGAEHTPGNLWGHVQISDQHLPVGDHEFEALGFEDCCDGHSELEVHLQCDAEDEYWRVVQSGQHDCMSCKTHDATCTAGTVAAAFCGSTGTDMACGGIAEAPPPERVQTADIYRLSDYPQGRIEVYSSVLETWGTVCGHWFWDNHNVAKAVCQKLGYEDGSLYTFGNSHSETVLDLPIVTGYRRCDLPNPDQPESETNRAPANIFDCPQHGNPGYCTTPEGAAVGLGSDDSCGRDGHPECFHDQRSCESANNIWTVDYDFVHPDGRCNHAIDQGAICLNAETQESLNCHTHNSAATCDDWHHCDSNGCQNCGGNAYARAMDGRQDSSQDLVFGCVEFASVYCEYDASSAATAASYADALNAYTSCASAPARPGYCRGALVSAAFLSNQDVCRDGASTNIAFHIRIPFQVNLAGTYRWRIHADYGRGSFIGVDGVEHTPGNTWGHLQYESVLTTGDHEYEALGFEDCCDGHSELEVQLVFDQTHNDGVWRVVVSGASQCLEGEAPLTEHPECQIDTDSAAQCGAVGSVASCSSSQTMRLSSTPQGRIEVWNPDANHGQGLWGTMCGHYYWDNDNPAIILCRALGYETGILYTYGSDSDLQPMPVVTGYRRCSPEDPDSPEDRVTNPLPDSLFGCESNPADWHSNGHNGDDGTPASPTDFDCTQCIDGNNDDSIDHPQANERESDCTHAVDQGAMCYNPSTHGATKCQTHAAAGRDDATCDDWHGCDGGCVKCSGCSFGCVNTDIFHPQDLVFGCVQFATTQCTYDVTSMEEPSYHAALRIFVECQMVDPQPEGYCMGSLASAAYLSNQDVCQGPGGAETGAANSNIGFHVRIPFRCNAPGIYNFRYHADFGLGSFIGVDGAEHTPGNLWGHLQLTTNSLELGDHEFESLGFEDCCDGHSELEVHLISDTTADPWRVVVSGETQCMQESGGSGCGPPADVGGSAGQCGQAGSVVTCTGSQNVRLSSYPQGRIEVFNQNTVGWGTVCGHWMWDNDNVANLVCRELGYDGGALYTYGDSAASPALPIVTGFRLCDGTEASIFECREAGNPEDRDCQQHGADCLTVDPSCTHSIDQGAICFHAADGGHTRCHQHHTEGQSNVGFGGDFTCDDWHSCTAGGCQTCRGALVGRADEGHEQDVTFGCVSFASTHCVHDVTANGDYGRALREFAMCAGVNPQPAGYCRGSLLSAALLANHDVCADGATRDIGFHIRIPFRVNLGGGTFHFRMHADYGMGTFVGVDGAEHTPGNTWGHLLLSAVTLTEGNHEFESLGFEDCCDGHAELEIHLPCDWHSDPWRIVTSGEHDCMRCEPVSPPPGSPGSCTVIGGGECLFPFDYKGDSYNACTGVDNGGTPWCYTDSDGTFWGNCRPGCPGVTPSTRPDTQHCASDQASAGCCGPIGSTGEERPTGGGSTCTGGGSCGDPYIGCFIDYAERDMKGEQIVLHDDHATLQTCSSYCYSRGYTFFGMQYSRECWCDNNYDYNGYGAQGVGEAESVCPDEPTCNADDEVDPDAADVELGGCNMACEGDATKMCGGSWRNSVYEVRGSGATLLDGLIAKYTFDDPTNLGADTSGNRHDGDVSETGISAVEGGGYERGTGSGYGGMSASFDGITGFISVPYFENYDWGSDFTVSLWFNRGCRDQACGASAGADPNDPADDIPRSPVCNDNYAGLISNGYYTDASWEVRMGRENGCTKLGGGVVTGHSAVPWDHDDLRAELGEWHHVTMIYDGVALHFYLDNERSTTTDDTGDMVRTAHPLTIGKAGEGDNAHDEFFAGMIDDVQIWSRALSEDEVQSLFNHQ